MKKIPTCEIVGCRRKAPPGWGGRCFKHVHVTAVAVTNADGTITTRTCDSAVGERELRHYRADWFLVFGSWRHNPYRTVTLDGVALDELPLHPREMRALGSRVT